MTDFNIKRNTGLKWVKQGDFYYRLGHRETHVSDWGPNNFLIKSVKKIYMCLHQRMF